MTMPRWRASSTPSRSSSFISAAGPRATRRGAISSLTWRATIIGSGSTRLWAISRPSRPSGTWQANRVHENGGRSHLPLLRREERRRRNRLLIRIAGAAIVVAVVIELLALVAVEQRDQARKQRAQAMSALS